MTVAQYDTGWTKWDDMKLYGPFARHVRRLIRHMLEPLEFTSVLDVGCGQGATLAELCAARPGLEPFGTDFSTTAIQLAQRRVPNGQFWVLDLTKEDLGRQFDLVLCSEVLEHIEEDVVALECLRRMTRKFLVVTTPQGRMRRFEPGEFGHVRNYAPGEMHRKLRSAGFEPLKTIEWGFPLYSPLYRNFLELMNGKGADGEFGLVRRTMAQVLFWAFMLNSWRRGDELVVLARPVEAPTV